jgi:hypothetical protein
MDRAIETARRRWVLQHRVWAEVVPSEAVAGHRDDWGPAGLCVRLYARCVPARLDPDRPGCREVHEVLSALLLSVVPAGIRCRVRPAEPALHLRPEAELTPEVELVAEIDAEDDPLTRIAPAERRAARVVLDRLGELGVQRRGTAAA